MVWFAGLERKQQWNERRPGASPHTIHAALHVRKLCAHRKRKLVQKFELETRTNQCIEDLSHTVVPDIPFPHRCLVISWCGIRATCLYPRRLLREEVCIADRELPT